MDVFVSCICALKACSSHLIWIGTQDILNHSFHFFLSHSNSERKPLLELLELSFFLPSLLNIIYFLLDFHRAPLEFIDHIVEGNAWTQKNFISIDFHPGSNIQIFEVVLLTLTVWSLHDIHGISIRLRVLDVIWIVFLSKPIIGPKTHKNYSMCSIL